jgi:hypothetical protein
VVLENLMRTLDVSAFGEVKFKAIESSLDVKP